MALERICKVFQILIVAGLIAVWIASDVRYYRKEGHLPMGEMEQPSVFVDEQGEDIGLLPPVSRWSPTQFYTTLAVGGVVMALLLWKLPFESDVDG